MATIKINGKAFTFNNIYYVDPVNGLDQNDGSQASPFLTVNYAISKCAAEGDVIFAKAGTPDVTRIAGEYDSGGLYDDNKSISFIGDKGKTIFVCDGRKHTKRDTHCIMFKNAGTKVYQVVFNYYTGGRTLNYETSICYGAGVQARGEVINCVFNITTNASPSLLYGNGLNSTIKFTHCLFNVPRNFTTSYSGLGAATTLENCASNFAFAAEAVRINTQINVKTDTDYHIISLDEEALNVGVHAGEYTWT